MDFLKALHDAESFGVSREMFLAAWERESQIREMELKHNLSVSNHNHHELLDSNLSNTIPQLEHLVFSFTQQVNQSLQQMSSIVGKELSEMRKYIADIDIRLKNVDSRSATLTPQILGVEDRVVNSLMSQLEPRLSRFEDSLAILPDIIKQSLNAAEKNPVSNGNCAPQSMQPLEVAQHIPEEQVSPSLPQENGDRYLPNSHPSVDPVSHPSVHATHPTSLPDTAPILNGHKPVQQKEELPQHNVLKEITPSSNGVAINGVNGCPPTTPKISYSAAVRVPPKSSSPVHHSGRMSDSVFGQKQVELGLPESPTEWKVGTSAGPLSMAKFAAVINGCTSISVLPKEGSDFCIKNLSKFVSSGQLYETDYFYSKGAPCRVRVRLWFNKHKRLCVSVQLAPGALDDRNTFPLNITGFGSVYNFGSRRYTQLWEVQSDTSVSGIPRGSSHQELPVYVCLCSSRDPTEEVSHDTLVKKHYADEDMLAIRWGLRADAATSSTSSSSSNTSFDRTPLEPPTGMW